MVAKRIVRKDLNTNRDYRIKFLFISGLIIVAALSVGVVGLVFIESAKVQAAPLSDANIRIDDVFFIFDDLEPNERFPEFLQSNLHFVDKIPS